MMSFLRIFNKSVSANKRILIVGTPRYSINAIDFFLFFRRTQYEVSGVYMHHSTKSKPWWKAQSKPDRARLDCYDPVPNRLLKYWKTKEKLLRLIEKNKPDYICVGNGNDEIGVTIKNSYDKNMLLFSEYGWLPWNEHFYIARGGTATESDVYYLDRDALQNQTIMAKEIDRIKEHFKSEGELVKYENFIYVPLQVDVNDFKFTLTDFRDNHDFLNFVCDIVPQGTKILVKNHPLNKNPTDLRPYKDRMIDISNSNLSRGQLYEKMKAMVCINSTSVLEAIVFGSRVFAYGRDIYQNKNLVYENIRDKKEFREKLELPEMSQISQKFISLLLERQVNRERCLANDESYLLNHYWANAL